MNKQEYNINRDILDNNVDKRIKLIIEDCCMKKIVRTTMYNYFKKILTSNECLLFSVYYYFSVLSVSYIMLSYNIVYMCVNYYLNLYYVSNFISMVINMLIIIRVLEELKDFIYILFCPCERNRNRIINQ